MEIITCEDFLEIDKQSKCLIGPELARVFYACAKLATIQSNIYSGPRLAVKEKACYAVEAFCEDLGDKIAPFLQPLTERLGALLQVGSRQTQGRCASAIASVALAAHIAADGFEKEPSTWR